MRAAAGCFLLLCTAAVASPTVMLPPSDGLSASDRASIELSIRPHISEAFRCFNVARARLHEIAGTVQLRFTMGSGGAVRSADAEENTTGDDELAKCIATKASAWRFSPSLRVGAKFSYPFAFEPRK